jgi:hypothetical protein
VFRGIESAHEDFCSVPRQHHYGLGVCGIVDGNLGNTLVRTFRGPSPKILGKSRAVRRVRLYRNPLGGQLSVLLSGNIYIHVFGFMLGSLLLRSSYLYGRYFSFAGVVAYGQRTIDPDTRSGTIEGFTRYRENLRILRWVLVKESSVGGCLRRGHRPQSD